MNDKSNLTLVIAWKDIEPYIESEDVRAFLSQIDPKTFTLVLDSNSRDQVTETILQMLKKQDPHKATKEYAEEIVRMMRQIANKLQDQTVDIKIQNPIFLAFYNTYKSDYTIIRDFYELLPEDKYDFRMVDTNTRKSDSPRESLAHILEVRLMYMSGIITGKLEFKDMGVEHYWEMDKEALLKEMDSIEKNLLKLLSNSKLEPSKAIATPWGNDTAINVLYALRTHEILHQGWNLAVMDHLDMPRYESLKNTWG